MDITVFSLNLPAGFDHAWDFPLTGEIPKTDTAHTKLPQESVRTTTKIATVVSPHLELGLALLLVDQRFLSHNSPSS
jgi:hypothetical protein